MSDLTNYKIIPLKINPKENKIFTEGVFRKKGFAASCYDDEKNWITNGVSNALTMVDYFYFSETLELVVEFDCSTDDYYKLVVYGYDMGHKVLKRECIIPCKRNLDYRSIIANLFDGELCIHIPELDNSKSVEKQREHWIKKLNDGFLSREHLKKDMERFPLLAEHNVIGKVFGTEDFLIPINTDAKQVWFDQDDGSLLFKLDVPGFNKDSIKFFLHGKEYKTINIYGDMYPIDGSSKVFVNTYLFPDDETIDFSSAELSVDSGVVKVRFLRHKNLNETINLL